MAHSRRDLWLGHLRAAAAVGEFQRLAPREPFLVVKGVALCARYGWDPAEVALSDVDIRVPPTAWWRLRAALKGSPVMIQDTPLYANFVLELAGHQVDVEATVGPPFLSRLRVGDMLGRAELATLPGIEPFLVPSTTDHALLLGINLFKDGISSASLQARRNAIRVVREVDFDAALFVRRARYAQLHGIMRLVSASLAPESASWRELAGALGADEHAWYTRLHGATHRRPRTFSAAVVRRLGSDSLRDRAVSAGLGLAFAVSGRGRSQL